jgi:hypothetical protein
MSTEDRSATWATDLDPNSIHGRHLRKGLEPVLQPETRMFTLTWQSLPK